MEKLLLRVLGEEKEENKRKFGKMDRWVFPNSLPSRVRDRTTDEREPHTALPQIGVSLGTNGST